MGKPLNEPTNTLLQSQKEEREKKAQKVYLKEKKWLRRSKMCEEIWISKLMKLLCHLKFQHIETL